ncbi:uncharacterized protein LOC117339592 [Pecten maximus]|uniref:uncharacterized protein LOC117339592 n=1 Tax=Pecten maximus TaxID=6579 RepID=UPI001459108A|nr:uncharacterized protein LOC117339592 [Pecten maximus]
MDIESLLNVWHIVVFSIALCVINISDVWAWNSCCKNGTLVALILFSGFCLLVYSVGVLFVTKGAIDGCVDFYPAMLITVNGALAATVWYLLDNNIETKPLWCKVAALCYVIITVASLIYLNSDSDGVEQKIQLESVLISSAFCHYDSKKIILPILLETVSLYVPVFGLFRYIFWRLKKLKPDIQKSDIKVISTCADLEGDRKYCDVCAKINTEIVVMLQAYGIIFLLLRPALHLYNYVVGSRSTDAIPIIIHMGGCLLLSVINLHHHVNGKTPKESKEIPMQII